MYFAKIEDLKLPYGRICGLEGMEKNKEHI
jgi:hypothetical protein